MTDISSIHYNDAAARQESPAVAAKRAQLAALKGRSNKLAEEQVELARLAQEIVQERERLDAEAEEALGQYAVLKEAEVWEGLPEAERDRISVIAVYDFETHKATAQRDEHGVIDVTTGRGLMVVRPLNGEAAAKSLRTGGRVRADGSVAMCDTSDESVRTGLLKACLFPKTPQEIQRICVEHPAFAIRVYEAVMLRSGAAAATTQGKSKS